MLNANIHLVAIYRPPPTKKNQLTPEIFFTGFATFLEEILISTGKLVILGDFEFHEIQHVAGSTHQSSHNIDLVITRTGDLLVYDLDIFK